MVGRNSRTSKSGLSNVSEVRCAGYGSGFRNVRIGAISCRGDWNANHIYLLQNHAVSTSAHTFRICIGKPQCVNACSQIAIYVVGEANAAVFSYSCGRVCKGPQSSEPGITDHTVLNRHLLVRLLPAIPTGNRVNLREIVATGVRCHIQVQGDRGREVAVTSQKPRHIVEVFSSNPVIETFFRSLARSIRRNRRAGESGLSLVGEVRGAGYGSSSRNVRVGGIRLNDGRSLSDFEIPQLRTGPIA